MKIKVILITIVVCALLIIIPSIINVTSTYKNNLIAVTEKRITEAAALCVLEENCAPDIVYLYELYELNYLEKESDPITKEYYDENSYVIFTGEETNFISVN